MKNAISSIIIAGGGTAGWMAAAVLSKALGPKIDIKLIESPSIATVGVGEATIPQIQHLNKFLGITEADFVQATKATYKLGIQFNDWGDKGQSYIHAFGDIGLPIGLVPFYHYWLRSCGEAPDRSLWDYSINAFAASKNKFQPLDRIGRTPLTGTRYAYHFDASLYALYLRQLSEAAGVKRIEATIAGAKLNPESGFIERLILHDNQDYSADLFIDCTGFSAHLIGKALGSSYENWSQYLPCNRAVVAASEGDGDGDARPYTQSNAQNAGWQWCIPLQHRMGNGYVYCSDFISDDKASETLKASVTGRLLNEPRLLRFTTGMRRNIWEKNCVALGLSAGFLEPLESTSIHLIQTGLNRLISLFPTRECSSILRGKYNKETYEEYLQIRDFLMLHYYASQRQDSEFWKHCKTLPISEKLKDQIDVFKSSARIERRDADLFSEVAWLQVLLGQNIRPRAYHPLADMLPEAQLNEFLSHIKTLIVSAVDNMPYHADFIDKTLGAYSAEI